MDNARTFDLDSIFGHVASPEVHVDKARKRIVMYFHA